MLAAAFPNMAPILKVVSEHVDACLFCVLVITVCCQEVVLVDVL